MTAEDKKHPIMLGLALVAIIAAIIWLNNGPVKLSTPAASPIGSNVTATSVAAPSPTCNGKAPELAGIADYINVDSITVREHLCKDVILVDFWTYTCINCQRTLPYLTTWDQKYRDKGLVIIGVHAPEFEFEKKRDNVLEAVKTWGIEYPIVLDNDHATWQAYANRFWPHKYLIGIDGNIVYDHVGEGGYEETEARIQQELMRRAEVLGMHGNITRPIVMPEEAVPVDYYRIGTPEIYFGYGFYRGNVGNINQGVPDQKMTFSSPERLEPNQAYLQGDWIIHADHAELAGEQGKVLLAYKAKVVNIVASGPADILTLVDGSEPDAAHGYSVDAHGRGRVDDETLYELVSSPDYGQHIIEIRARKGFRLYTFTFG